MDFASCFHFTDEAQKVWKTCLGVPSQEGSETGWDPGNIWWQPPPTAFSPKRDYAFLFKMVAPSLPRQPMHLGAARLERWASALEFSLSDVPSNPAWDCWEGLYLAAVHCPLTPHTWAPCSSPIIEFFQENALVIANTLFQQHKRRLYTWTSPDGQHQNQIDYILCSQRWTSYIQSAKTRLGADCGSDHEHFIAKFRLKMEESRENH